MYNPDYWEIAGDAYESAMQALTDWNNFVADMATNPYDDEFFAWG